MNTGISQNVESEAIVRHALRRRGIRCGSGRHQGAIRPRSAAACEALYELLKHYSFRLFLRDLIRLRDGAAISDLTHYCSRASAQRFVRALQGAGVVRAASNGRLRLRDQNIHSFGPTLECFVADVLQREYGMATAWSLRPDGAAGGGDYDVVGVADGALVYIEVKSSAPRNIEQKQIAAFVDRMVTLMPDVAILLNDTQLRMLDKLVPALRTELRRQPFAAGPLRRIQGEIFGRGDRLFVTNSEPDLIANLGVCLARFFRARSAA